MCGFKHAIRGLLVCLLALAVTGCFDEETTEVGEADGASTSSGPEAARLSGAVSRSNTTVLVSFSKTMRDSALDIGNYSIVQSTESSQGGTLSIVSAAFDPASTTAVVLTTRSQSDV